MPSVQEFIDMPLEDIGEFLSDGTGTSQEIANALYELKFRAQLMEVSAKGGDRPTHNPPNP